MGESQRLEAYSQEPTRAEMLEWIATEPHAVVEWAFRTYGKDLTDWLGEKILRNDPESVDDVIQQTYVKVFTHIHTWKGESALKTWIFSIAKNAALSMRRSQKRKEKNKSRLTAGHEELLTDKKAIAPISSLERKDMANLLHRLVGELPDDQRVALTLQYFEGKTGPEIAEEFGENPDTIKTRIKRGRDTLRNRLKGFGITGDEYLKAS